MPLSLKLPEAQALGSQPPISPDAPDLPQDLRAVGTLRLVDQLALDRSQLRRVDLSGQTATDVRVSQCRLDDVALHDARLGRTTLEDVEVIGGSWANATLAESR